MDEPTASLDDESKEKVRVLMEQLVREGTTMLGIFHDMLFMQNLCDVEYRMLDGEIIKYSEKIPLQNIKNSLVIQRYELTVPLHSSFIFNYKWKNNLF